MPTVLDPYTLWQPPTAEESPPSTTVLERVNPAGSCTLGTHELECGQQIFLVDKIAMENDGAPMEWDICLAAC